MDSKRAEKTQYIHSQQPGYCKGCHGSGRHVERKNHMQKRKTAGRASREPPASFNREFVSKQIING